jgi:hypothetical protein
MVSVESSEKWQNGEIGSQYKCVSSYCSVLASIYGQQHNSHGAIAQRLLLTQMKLKLTGKRFNDAFEMQKICMWYLMILRSTINVLG